jgi:murein DD-endopeptidase
VKATERKKKPPLRTTRKNTTQTKQTASSKTKTKSSRTAHTAKSKASQTAANLVTEKCITRKGHKAKCTKVTKIAEVHKVRVQKAQKTAMNKLMGQIGKPYRWGGTSPRTGFDCSGLVYYAYKDLVKFRIPRTANEMYHLRDASPVDRGELENGDLVFFRTRVAARLTTSASMSATGNSSSHHVAARIFRSPLKRRLLGTPLRRRVA